jgi:hypothetical protein
LGFRLGLLLRCRGSPPLEIQAQLLFVRRNRLRDGLHRRLGDLLSWQDQFPQVAASSARCLAANGAVVWRALAKFGAPVGDVPPDELAEPGTFFTWGNPPFRVDAWSRRLIHTVNAETGPTPPLICAEDLIANKQSAGQEEGREQDIADAAAVRRATRRIPDEE